jgi:ABC-2 type transport system ATP-binding protein
MNIIEINKLTKIYHGSKIKALNDLKLSISEGEVFGFIGPNGAGKTTTIRLLLDLIRPTAGSAEIFGLDIHDQTVKIRKNIGFLPGEIFLPESTTGRDCIKYFSGFKKEVEKDYLKALIKNFDLDLNKKIKAYSKGNKQKLAIILALMHKPKLLILDEPTSGLDPLNQQTFYKAISETKRWGTTTFLSTHLLEEAEKICDRVGIIKAGKLIKIENIDEFKEKNIREIHLETKDSIPLSEFKMAEIQKVERTTYGYRLVTLGKNGGIIKKLLKNNIDDIKVTEPSLEEIFLHYYKDGND